MISLKTEVHNKFLLYRNKANTKSFERSITASLLRLNMYLPDANVDVQLTKNFANYYWLLYFSDSANRKF